MQLSYSRLWDGYATDKQAMLARNAKLRELRKAGHRAYGWTLRDQTRPYAGLGQPDGRSCNLYMIDAEIAQ